MKIALIEDRIGRMKQFSEIDISTLEEITLITGADFKVLLAQFDQGDTKPLTDYDCILAHRSALSVGHQDVLRQFCQQVKKPLVFFSGGITSSLYNDKGVPFLLINSKDFYSHNLALFVKDASSAGSANLRILQFGTRWKLNLLLHPRDHVNHMVQLKSIRWVRDLQIDNALKAELTDKFALDWLKQGELKGVTEPQVKEFYAKLHEAIIEAL